MDGSESYETLGLGLKGRRGAPWGLRGDRGVGKALHTPKTKLLSDPPSPLCQNKTLNQRPWHVVFLGEGPFEPHVQRKGTKAGCLHGPSLQDAVPGSVPPASLRLSWGPHHGGLRVQRRGACGPGLGIGSWSHCPNSMGNKKQGP